MERTVRFWIGAGLLSAILICGIGPLALSQEKKEDEKKEAPGQKSPNAAVLEARAAHLLRAAKRLVSRKKWSADREFLPDLVEFLRPVFPFCVWIDKQKVVRKPPFDPPFEDLYGSIG